MFRLKIFPIIQNILNRNVHNTIHKNHIRCALFSTDALNGSSSKVSKKTSEILRESTANDLKIHDLEQPADKNSDDSSLSNVSHPIKSKADKLYKKIEFEIRGHDKAVLRSYSIFANTAACHLDISYYRKYPFDKPIHERLTLLKSAYVHKKHRVQYEARTYYSYFHILNVTGSTADTYIEYIQRNLPEGVAMKVTMVELQTLPKTVKQAVFCNN